MKKIILSIILSLFIGVGLTQVNTFPHVTDFELGFGDWTNASGDNFDWGLINGAGTPSSGTGPQLVPYGGNFSSGYTYCESSSPNYPNKQAWLECKYDFSALTAPHIDIHYHMYSSYNTSSYGPGTLSLDVFDGTIWTYGIWSNSTSNAAWQTSTIDLSAYAGLPYVILSWTGNTIGWQSDMCLDELNLFDNTSGNTGGNVTVVEVGDPNSTTSNGRVPTYGYYEYSWSAAMYAPADMNNKALLIDKISWNVANGATMTLNNQEIWLSHTPEVIFPNGLLPDDGNGPWDNFTKVFDGTLNLNPGWNDIDLLVPFAYDGVQSLIVKVINNHGTWTSNYPEFQYTSRANTVVYNYADGSFPSSMGFRNSYRPNTRFEMGGSPLPIELVSFNGEVLLEMDPIVILDWTVASQVNNDYYEIQRSIDVEQWETIEKITGAGTNNTQMHYSIIDDNPILGISYYRLKQTDYNGESETFNPISIIINSTEKEIDKIINVMGQEVTSNYSGLVIELYTDGTSAKKYKN